MLDTTSLRHTLPRVAAGQVLRRVWGSEGSYPIVPVDPVQIARALGLEVYVADLEYGMSGMLIKRAFQDPEIYLRADDSKNRQRFTCAHELGHYIQRVPDDNANFTYKDERANLSSRGINRSEIYANQFAAELLMPEKVVKARRETGEPLLLHYDFGVSAEAMRIRLEDLGLAG